MEDIQITKTYILSGGRDGRLSEIGSLRGGEGEQGRGIGKDGGKLGASERVMGRVRKGDEWRTREGDLRKHVYRRLSQKNLACYRRFLSHCAILHADFQQSSSVASLRKVR